MRTRYGISPWIDAFPRSRRPEHARLRGEITCEVAIVGGGLTGCATAYTCAVAGLRPILIEADRLGQGSSGRGAGLLLSEPGPSFRELAARHGLRASRRVFEGWRRASLDAASLLRRLGIPCGLETCESLAVAFRDQERALRREYQARKDAGLDSRWANQAAVAASASLGAAGGLRVSGCFTFDPYRACLGLATSARARGGTFFERSVVKRVRAGRKHVEIVTDGGLVRAASVVVCTGSATGEFKPLRRHFKPLERYQVMTEPVPAAVRKQLGGPGLTIGDAAQPPHRIRWTRDNRLLVAGADQEQTPLRLRDAVRVQRTGQLMYELLTMYPAISGLQPAYGWESAYGETADGLMYVGRHRNYPRHLFALGGRSATASFLAARLLARAVHGDREKGDEVFGWTR